MPHENAIVSSVSPIKISMETLDVKSFAKFHDQGVSLQLEKEILSCSKIMRTSRTKKEPQGQVLKIGHTSNALNQQDECESIETKF